ncbi:hypothetical protein, partial [Luteibacter sp.]|uniref:hypothetical protein n=1 Tax=Luteibacter sp. TaxID=1886636 RepID=UPI002F3F64EF
GWPERRSEVPVVASRSRSMERSADEWSAAMHVFQDHPTTRHETVREPYAVQPSAPDDYDPRQLGAEKHALYCALQERIPEASPDRLLQFTAACHAHRISASNLDTIHVDEPSMTVNIRGKDWLATPAVIDLTVAPPLPEQSVAQIQQVDQQRMQIAHEIAQAAQLSQQGPVL